MHRRRRAQARPPASIRSTCPTSIYQSVDDWWQQWFADNGVPADEAVLRRPGIRLENQANEGHAAMAGQGFALLTPCCGRATRRRAAKVLFPERVSSRGWAYWLVFPPERRTVPKIKRFREWLVAEMRRAVSRKANGGWAGAAGAIAVACNEACGGRPACRTCPRRRATGECGARRTQERLSLVMTRE